MAHPPSPRRSIQAHPTPPPLPALTCYRCNRAPVLTWVVENPSSRNLGKRFYKCSDFREGDDESCRFGFMWHDEYGRILKKLGAVDPQEDLFEEGSSSSGGRFHSAPAYTHAAARFEKPTRVDPDKAIKALICISIAMVIMSIAQIGLALAIYARI